MSARNVCECVANGNVSSSSLVISEDFMSRVDVADVTDFEDFRSAILSECKRQILRPYLRLLAIMGLRNIGTDESKVWARLQLSLAAVFTLFGYVLQYLLCFRRDHGLSIGPNDSRSVKTAVFGYILPNALHFLGYVYILYLFRCKETERLENLMEKTFLLSAHRANGKKTHLVRRLWMFIYGGIFWVIASLIAISLLVAKRNFDFFRWLHSEPQKFAFKTFLALTILWQDMIQATVISSYCIQVQLLSSSLYFLQEKLIQRTIHPLSWIREINECQNVLTYLNRHFSPGVCIFIFLDASWILSCLVQIIKKNSDEDRASMIVAVSLWTVAVTAPFALAANLSSACNNLRRSGHEVRIRPFVYQCTPEEDLDTILLYTSTLKMKTKLFSIPVAGHCYWVFLLLFAISILVAGQSSLF